MSVNDQVYRRLQKHLDSQTMRFPALRSGADLRLLKHIFDPEEARIARELSYKFESLEDIHERLKGSVTSVDDLRIMLDRMVQKGGIGYTERQGMSFYRNLPLVVGMYEANIHRLTPEFLADFGDFKEKAMFSYGLSFISTKPPQFRTIPVEQSITTEPYVARYDELRSLIEQTEGPIVVTQCICRLARRMGGDPCKKTTRSEVCVVLDNSARLCIKKGIGRQINREEALEIARQNEKEGLILNTSNAQKPEFICGCCGCCCGFVCDLAKMPRPAQFFPHNYFAEIDRDLCVGCGTCSERCQMDAVKAGNKQETASIDLYRCIGCGTCVPTCGRNAIRLMKRRKEVVPPETDDDLYDNIMANRRGTLLSLLRVLRTLLKNPRA
jgi:electron transport complex protein RnfB